MSNTEYLKPLQFQKVDNHNLCVIVRESVCVCVSCKRAKMHARECVYKCVCTQTLMLMYRSGLGFINI